MIQAILVLDMLNRSHANNLFFNRSVLLKQLTVALSLLVASSGNLPAIADQPRVKSEKAENESIKEKSAYLEELRDLVRARSYFKARAKIKQLLRRYPDDSNVHLAAARLYKAMGLWSRSILEYELVKRANPQLPEPYVELSKMHLENLSADLALSLARQGVNLDPDSKEAHMALISALIANYDYREADQELKSLTERFPASPDVLYIAYSLKKSNGHLEEARSYLEKAIDRAPDHISWLFDLHDVAEAQGDVEGARDAIERYLKISPQSTEALLKLALIHERYLADYNTAEKTYDRILAIDPDNWNALVGKDRIKIRKNDIAMAIKRSLRQWWGGFSKWLLELLR